MWHRFIGFGPGGGPHKHRLQQRKHKARMQWGTQGQRCRHALPACVRPHEEINELDVGAIAAALRVVGIAQIDDTSTTLRHLCHRMSARPKNSMYQTSSASQPLYATATTPNFAGHGCILNSKRPQRRLNPLSSWADDGGDKKKDDGGEEKKDPQLSPCPWCRSARIRSPSSSSSSSASPPLPHPHRPLLPPSRRPLARGAPGLPSASSASRCFLCARATAVVCRPSPGSSSCRPSWPTARRARAVPSRPDSHLYWGMCKSKELVNTL